MNRVINVFGFAFSIVGIVLSIYAGNTLAAIWAFVALTLWGRSLLIDM